MSYYKLYVDGEFKLKDHILENVVNAANRYILNALNVLAGNIKKSIFDKPTKNIRIEQHFEEDDARVKILFDINI